MTLDAGTGYDSYLWSTGETTQTIAVTPTETTAYDVTVTLGDCEGSGEITITVSDNPTPVITADPDESVCEGTTATLDAGASYDSYLWSTGEATQTIEVTPAATTTYDVTVTLGDCEGSGEITITVSDNPAPTITADPGESVCEGTTVDAGRGSRLWQLRVVNRRDDADHRRDAHGDHDVQRDGDARRLPGLR